MKLPLECPQDSIFQRMFSEYNPLVALCPKVIGEMFGYHSFLPWKFLVYMLHIIIYNYVSLAKLCPTLRPHELQHLY